MTVDEKENSSYASRPSIKFEGICDGEKHDSLIGSRCLPKFNSHRRKMSVPAILYAPNLSVHSSRLGVCREAFAKHAKVEEILNAESQGEQETASQRYRRFSNVGNTVSRKLSINICWRSVNIQEIVTQTKCLCGQFIKARLKISGIHQRKVGVQRVWSLASIARGSVIYEIFSHLHVLGCELERMSPKLYVDISRQVAVTITNEKSMRGILSSIAQVLLRPEVTWSKIVSLYCVAGGLAVDCVHSGHPEYLHGLIETMGLVMERDGAAWIANQGGWTSLVSHHKPPDDEAGYFQLITISVLGLIVVLTALIFLLRTIGNMALG